MKKSDFFDYSLVDFVPELRHEGDGFQIYHFSRTKEQVRMDGLRAVLNFNHFESRYPLVPGKKYVRLVKQGVVWMSDTPMERHTNREFIYHAHGDVFIAGLGLGLIIFPLLRDKGVKSITVLEKNKELIDFMRPCFKKNSKLSIIEGDALLYWEAIKFSKEEWDTIYFDIWPSINADNYQEMKFLHRKYRKHLKKLDSSWMSSWLFDWCKREISQLNKEERDRAFIRKIIGGFLDEDSSGLVHKEVLERSVSS